jgi:hypothetical protein
MIRQIIVCEKIKHHQLRKFNISELFIKHSQKPKLLPSIIYTKKPTIFYKYKAKLGAQMSISH